MTPRWWKPKRPPPPPPRCGSVFCKSCKNSTIPIKGAVVKLECKNTKKEMEERTETDENFLLLSASLMPLKTVEELPSHARQIEGGAELASVAWVFHAHCRCSKRNGNGEECPQPRLPHHQIVECQ
ncbi:unnamed protein product [Cuscuta campestris]|uniref:Uncharacterized protein n=1 Tax=Cuscuta campestris TaxID=132261 RepID=A0A484N5Z9_9ASTE|nr:unnamed protein product [Cuscuta campestris]